MKIYIAGPMRGIRTMSPYISGQNWPVRMLIVGAFSAIVGISTNEAFAYLATADQVPTLDRVASPSPETPGRDSAIAVATANNEAFLPKLWTFTHLRLNPAPSGHRRTNHSRKSFGGFLLCLSFR